MFGHKNNWKNGYLYQLGTKQATHGGFQNLCRENDRYTGNWWSHYSGTKCSCSDQRMSFCVRPHPVGFQTQSTREGREQERGESTAAEACSKAAAGVGEMYLAVAVAADAARILGSVEDTKLSTNKQHSLSRRQGIMGLQEGGGRSGKATKASAGELRRLTGGNLTDTVALTA